MGGKTCSKEDDKEFSIPPACSPSSIEIPFFLDRRIGRITLCTGRWSEVADNGGWQRRFGGFGEKYENVIINGKIL